MAFLRDLVLGGMALKGLARSNPPTVIVPSRCVLIGMSHKGFGSAWKVTYARKATPNSHLSFTISKGITSRTEGSESWSFHWN